MTSSTRFVLDTNLVISALLMPQSTPRQAFDTAFAVGEVLICQAAIEELDQVLRRSKFNRYVSQEERLRFLAAYVRDAQPVEITVAINVCRDPKDNKFLELAVCGSAACILSGDQDLLSLSPFRGIEVLSPMNFLQTY